jgi:hypothetical protein
MGNILISGGLIPTTPNTLVDARGKVPTFAKIAEIENPALYMVITVEDTGKKYEVKKLTSKVIGGIVVQNAAIDINDPEALLDLGLAEEQRAEDERVRQANEDKRIEAESLRKSAEDSRNSNEANRISTESARNAAEKTRANSEEVRNSSEQTRISNESKRQSQESTRQNQESSRVNAENIRKESESARGKAELKRNENESSRISAELAREREEGIRSRSEQNRVSAENTRSSAEDRRVSNENQRLSNESARNEAETSREQAEDYRATTFDALKTELETTIQEGQEANTLSEAATQRANEAAETIEEWDSTVATIDEEGDVNDPESDIVNEAIRKTPQTLTKAEQTQARTNIGAASLEENAAFKTEMTESNKAFKTETNTKLSEIGSEVGGISLGISSFSNIFEVEEGEVSSNDNFINIEIEEGYYNFNIENISTNNEGKALIYVLFDGDSNKTQVSSIDIGTWKKVKIERKALGVGVYMSSSSSNGLMRLTIVKENSILKRIEDTEYKSTKNETDIENLKTVNDINGANIEEGVIKSNGARATSKAYNMFTYPNMGYTFISCKVYCSSDFSAVAFYNSEEISAETYMEGSIVPTSTQTWEYHKIKIPEGCKTIVVCNRTGNLSEPFISLYADNFKVVYQNIGDIKTKANNYDFENFKKAVSISTVDEIVVGYSIYYDSGKRTSASTQTLYKIRNFGYSKLKCTLNSNSSTFAAVAFYKSDDIDESMYDKDNSVVSISAARSMYEVNVPEDCKLIVVTNKSGTYEPIIEVYAKNIENVIEKHNAEFNQISDVIGFNTDNIIDLNYPLTMPTLLNSIQISKTDDRLSVENLVIAHCSDVHGQSDNLLRFVEFVEKYKEYIDDSICTGDMIFNVWSDDFNYWSECGGDKILLTIGNHETAIEPNIWSGATHQDVYERFISPFVKNWGVIHEEGNTWYYKDYTSQKIRMVVIDPYYEQETQITWFESVLSDAITNKLSVVVFEHNPFQSYNPIECSFNSLFRMGEGSLGSMIVPYMDKVEIFAANGGEFICWVCGHMHKDAVGTHSDYPNQMMVAVPATKIEESNNEDKRIVGTKSQDCFNIISFDVTHKCVKVIRIGSDTDSCLRNRGTLCVNYLTKKILWNN